MPARSVLLVGNYPPPYGGVPQHISRLAPYLAGRGWDVHVVSGGWGRHDEQRNGISVYRYRRSRLPADLAMGAARSTGLSPLLLSSPRDWARYAAKLAIARRVMAAHRIDVISAYNLVTGGIVGAVLAEQSGVPLVVSNFGELHSRPDFVARHGDLLRRVCSAARAYMSCSVHCARSYGLLGVSPHVQVIPYGVDLNRFSDARRPAEARSRVGILGDDPVVLYMGRMNQEMGLDTFLTAVPRIVDSPGMVRCVIAGAGGELAASAKAMAAKYPRHVLVSVDVSPDALPDYYAAASVVVVPTAGDRACSSLAAMEAMAAGRPVVAANVGGVPEVVLDGVTGVLVPPRDAERLAREVLALLGDPARLARMAISGRERAVAEYDEQITNRRVEQVFNEIAGNPAPGRRGVSIT